MGLTPAQQKKVAAAQKKLPQKPAIHPALVKPPAVGNIKLAATPNTVPVIPGDWANFGAEAGYAPKSAEDLNFWIVGPSGEGKTTFNSSIPNQIILDFDDAAGSVPASKAVRIKIKNYEHYEQIIQKLITEGKANKRCFHRIAIDTVDEWMGMITNRLQAEKGVDNILEFGSKGHGVSLIRERCWSKLKELEEAGYVWSCIGHMITKTETNPSTHQERTVVRDAIFPTMSAKIVRSSDFKITVYCINKEIEKKVEQKLPGGQTIKVPCGTEIISTYYINTVNTSEHEGKNRAPGMEKKFEIPGINGWEVFKQKYNVAIEAAKKQYC